MILDVSVELDESEVNGFFVIEPTQNCVEPHPLLSVPLLVDSSTHVTMKARVINPFPDSVIINQNTVVGVADHVMPYAKSFMSVMMPQLTVLGEYS